MKGKVKNHEEYINEVAVNADHLQPTVEMIHLSIDNLKVYFELRKHEYSMRFCTGC